MKRNRLLAVCLAAVLLLSACGGGSNGGAEENPSASSGAANGDLGMSPDYEMESSASGAPESPVYQNAGAKLIRRAELEIQTEQFDQAAGSLSRLVSDCGGYFEQAAVYGGSYRDANAARWGEYIVRVPAERYREFFDSAGSLGYVTSSSESSQDVGEQYHDTEARLKTQRTKQARLLSLLEQAATMEDIIQLENALSDVEYEIEQLSSTLNRYDGLIGFSTFTITLNEVGKVTQEVGETSSLGQRMAAGVRASLEGLVRGGQEMLVWCSYHLVLVLLLAAAAAVGGVAGCRRYKKWKKERKTPEE